MQCDVGILGINHTMAKYSFPFANFVAVPNKQTIGKYANIWLECGVKVERPEIHVISELKQRRF